MALDANSLDFVMSKLQAAHEALQDGKRRAVIPNGYTNFELALSITSEALTAFAKPETTADAAMTPTLIRRGIAALGLFNAGPAQPAVTTAMRNLQDIVDRLDPTPPRKIGTRQDLAAIGAKLAGACAQLDTSDPRQRGPFDRIHVILGKLTPGHSEYDGDVVTAAAHVLLISHELDKIEAVQLRTATGTEKLEQDGHVVHPPNVQAAIMSLRQVSGLLHQYDPEAFNDG